MAEGSPTHVRDPRDSGSGHPKEGRGVGSRAQGPGLCFARPGCSLDLSSFRGDRESSQASWAFRDTRCGCHHRERRPSGTGSCHRIPIAGSQTVWPHTRKYRVFGEPATGGSGQKHPNTVRDTVRGFQAVPHRASPGEWADLPHSPGQEARRTRMPRAREGAGLVSPSPHWTDTCVSAAVF